MSAKTIDTITTVFGIIIAILEPARYYFETNATFNGFTFAACILTALVAYFTGKSVQAPK